MPWEYSVKWNRQSPCPQAAKIVLGEQITNSMGKYHVIPGSDGVWRTDEAGEGTDMPRGSVLDGIATEGLYEEMVFGGKGREGSWNIWECHTQKDLRLEYAW